MNTTTTLPVLARLTMLTLTAAGLSCGSSGAAPAAAAACDASCRDAAALLGLRDAIKEIYNIGLFGQPTGVEDAGVPRCPLGGSAIVYGHATSNADQGSTSVDLTYVFDHCGYSNVDTDPTQVFSLTLTGTITESGTIAVQPSTTTALVFQSASMTITGTVYSPPVSYDASGGDGGACAIMLGQNGNDLSGALCGRSAGVTL